MFSNKLLHIKPLKDIPVIEETLSRMGIADTRNRRLYQSCHVVNIWGDWYLAHFKQLFQYTRTKEGLPGYGNVSMEDMARRDSVANRLRNWGLVDFDKDETEDKDTRIFVVPYKEKKSWQCITKIDIRNVEFPQEHL